MLRFYAGETVKLDFTHKLYPKAEWTAELIMKTGQATETYAASGVSGEEKFRTTIVAATSAGIAVGEYQIVYKYTNISSSEVSILPGPNVYFRPDPTAAGDQRTQPEIDLEALDSAIRAKITNGAVESYTIETTVGKRNIQNMALEELRSHRRFLIAQVDKERTKAGLPRIGGNQWKKIRSNLGNQTATSRANNY